MRLRTLSRNVGLYDVDADDAKSNVDNGQSSDPTWHPLKDTLFIS